MIDGRRVFAIIPARGGSKGVPGKNLRPLYGRPLIEWTIQAGRACRYIDRMLVSSDDAAIRAAAESAGCEAPFARPAELATDEAGSIGVIRHAMKWACGQEEAPYDYVVLLQPTSPFRSAADIDACIEACQRTGAPIVVSVSRPRESPYWMYRRDEQGRLEALLPIPPAARRQDLPQTVALNGAVYVMRWDFVLETDHLIVPETRCVEMPEDRSVDIDTPLDFLLAEALASARSTGL